MKSLKPDVNEMIERLERLVSATKELAPMRRGKSVFGVRSYSESFLDNEWEIILAAMRAYTSQLKPEGVGKKG